MRLVRDLRACSFDAEIVEERTSTFTHVEQRSRVIVWHPGQMGQPGHVGCGRHRVGSIAVEGRRAEVESAAPLYHRTIGEVVARATREAK